MRYDWYRSIKIWSSVVVFEFVCFLFYCQRVCLFVACDVKCESRSTAGSLEYGVWPSCLIIINLSDGRTHGRSVRNWFPFRTPPLLSLFVLFLVWFSRFPVQLVIVVLLRAISMSDVSKNAKRNSKHLLLEMKGIFHNTIIKLICWSNRRQNKSTVYALPTWMILIHRTTLLFLWTEVIFASMHSISWESLDGP